MSNVEAMIRLMMAEVMGPQDSDKFSSIKHHIPTKYIANERKKKPCLHCSKGHTHNNSFCSPSCCKEWRQAKKSL